VPLPTSSLAKICNSLREYVGSLGEETTPDGWDVNVSIGAPGVNISSSIDINTINMFFYRFEPFGFDADALPADVQYIRVMCFITAFGVDEDTNEDLTVDFTAGFNELMMLSQVMRLFQENPVLQMEGDDENELWYTQFILRPLADEQINQIWSSQGDTVYRPSLIYEISLAPIEPLLNVTNPPKVASFGTYASTDMVNRFKHWPVNRDLRFPSAQTVSIDTFNPKWAPAVVMVTGIASDRQADLSLNFEVPVADGMADFSSFPEIDLWIAGDTLKSSDLTIIGQIYQNPKNADDESWMDIEPVTGLSADSSSLDMLSLPLPSPDSSAVSFTLNQSHWTGIDNTKNNWQLQIYVERYLMLDRDTNTWIDVEEDAAELRIRSNPLLITLTRETA